MSDGTQARRLVLMNPGPVMTDGRVRSALTGPDLCHREVEFEELLQRVRQLATRVTAPTGEYETVVLTGSGTAAVEAVVASAVPTAGRLLALDNGHYGRRMYDVAVANGVPSELQSFGWGVPLDLRLLDETLARDSSITHVSLVHHETSTGMLNPLKAAADLVARHQRALVVDAISSIGIEPIDLTTTPATWLVGSSNKGIEGMPGLAFVTARRTSWEALSGSDVRSYYLDLRRHYAAQLVGIPAFTPAIPVFYAFDVALSLLLEEGVARRHRRYRDLAEELREGLQELGLTLLLPMEQRATAVTAVELPAGMAFGDLHRALRAVGFVIYKGQEHQQESVFRLSTMGTMRRDDVCRFLACLRDVLATHGRGT